MSSATNKAGPSLGWWIAQLGALFIFLVAAVSQYPAPGLEHCTPDFGDSLKFLFLLPIFLLVAIFVAATIIVALRRILRHRNPQLLAAVGLIAVVWTLVVIFEWRMMYRVVTPDCPVEQLR